MWRGRRRDADDGRRSWGIHFFRGWQKKQVRPLLFQQHAIALLIARIAREVFGRTELSRIDEDRDDDEVGPVLPRDTNQGEVAFVKKAHGRNETNRRRSRVADRGARLLDCPSGDQFTFGIGTTTASPYSFFSSSVVLMWNDSVLPSGKWPLRTSCR